MVVVAARLVVPTANVSVVEPAPMVTLAGTVTAVVLLASVMTAPAAGAAAVRVTTALTVVPPTTVPVDKTMLDKAATVGAVVAVVSEQPDAARLAVSETAATEERSRWKRMTFNDFHVAGNPRHARDRGTTGLWQTYEDFSTASLLAQQSEPQEPPSL
jgi:hypothetical protein